MQNENVSLLVGIKNFIKKFKNTMLGVKQSIKLSTKPFHAKDVVLLYMLYIYEILPQWNSFS